MAYAGALVGTILVGAGVVFSSHGDMQKVGAAMYKSWVSTSSAIGSKISALASWAVEHGEAAAKGALRIGKELYQGVVDAFNASYSDGIFRPVAAAADFSTFLSASPSSDFWVTLPYTDKLIDWRAPRFEAGNYYDYKFIFSYEIKDDGSTNWSCSSMLNGTSAHGQSGGYNSSTATGFYYYSVDSDELFINVQYKKSDGTLTMSQSTLCYDLSSYDLRYIGLSRPESVSCIANDLVYPSDNYLVKMPDLPAVDEVTGSATWPSDAAYTKDAVAVPYPVDTEGVKVPDIPYDKVVDKSTGKTLDDTGTDTDKPGTDTDKPGTDTGGLLGQIVALLKNFFDSPSDFRLNMDGFRNLVIKDKFPFCIPFDMVDSVKQFAADAADYQFRVKLDTQYFKVDRVVDLTPLAVPLAFFRYLVVAWFAWVLMSRTHDLMKW